MDRVLVITSRKKKTKKNVIFNDYRYVTSSSKKKAVYWRCDRYLTCPATASSQLFDPAESIFPKFMPSNRPDHQHNHAPDATDSQIMVLLETMRQRAGATTESLHSIFDTVLASTTGSFLRLMVFSVRVRCYSLLFYVVSFLVDEEVRARFPDFPSINSILNRDRLAKYGNLPNTVADLQVEY